ncbi:murein hydrolase activator EnvC family protein [Halarcobacter bivalviorum]|uniref:Peptidase M23 n=1 Tax=Halarcobacter bivalviorum TaxID=663364 RepID=A0AAX2AEA8_9BACT|nr:peptidoglycan DD-metalloendopeptidase family protein [Halarcobacter bivalviorum]AXH11926.1 zinc metallopeptidase, M23 family [Halarcobacter bivalviorum]RXK11046.1 peptidase M23 [Halarcobacter bivalviorum]
MIKKLTLLFIVSITLLGNSTKSIDKKIENNKLILQKNKKEQEQKDLQIRILAKQIDNQNKELSRLEKAIKIVNEDIEKHQTQLSKAKDALVSLQKDSKDLINEKKNNEEKIVDTIINEFSSSIALKLAGESSVQELIDSEVYTILSQNSKDEIIKINNNYELVTQNKKENQQKINKISDYIEDRIKKKKELNILKRTHSKSLVSLEKKHEEYQVELKKTVQQQDSLKQLLGKLNILKKEEIEKQRKAAIEKAKRLAALKKRQNKKAQKNADYEVSDEDRNNSYAKNLDLDVRMIGSSTSGVKISKYRGRKTIAPLDSFQVVKKFGKYFDPVYKIELFNESIVLKTKVPQAKVKSIFNGKIVYAKKDAGMLENVVIVQHRNGLHTIYSHLDQISPSLKVGRWIKKGYVVGRVSNTLTFQATKNEMHINPRDLFKI